MVAIERLKRDHDIFRSKLITLEGALGLGEDSFFVMREICFSLSRQLPDHILRETTLGICCIRVLRVVGAGELERFSTEHHGELKLLRFINRFFAQGTSDVPDSVRVDISKFIRAFRAVLDEQERKLFPILNQALCVGNKSQLTFIPGRCAEDITVSQLVSEYPRTRDTLERLFINVEVEGCYCLDEVALRHGIELDELVDKIKHALADNASTAFQETAA